MLAGDCARFIDALLACLLAFFLSFFLSFLLICSFGWLALFVCFWVCVWLIRFCRSIGVGGLFICHCLFGFICYCRSCVCIQVCARHCGIQALRLLSIVLTTLALP